MSWFSSKVTVSIIDDANGTILASAKIANDDLPDTFGIDTTLHIGNDNWSVVHADPLNKIEFKKSGKLTLRLRKITMVNPKELSFSQVDIIDQFDDNAKLGPDVWIETKPLNAKIENPETAGLPSINATSEDVYKIAFKMSMLRESFPIPNDGVYCPICHLANVDIGKLHAPCPKCGRELLKFGWT